MFLTIITFVVILGLLVFVHELGHFVAAKKAGVAVEEFGFGFPPRIFGIRRKETIYSINWIPLGGFVKLKGESGASREDEDSFGHKKIWKRAVILAAGVGMNFVLAAVLLSIGYFVGLPQVIDGGPEQYAAKNIKIQVISVLKNSPAEEAGLEIGDTILNIDGREFGEIEDVQNYIAEAADKVTLEIDREGEKLAPEITPKLLEPDAAELPEGETLPERKLIGVGLVKTGIISYPWHISIGKGFASMVSLTGRIIAALYGLLRDMIVSHQVTADVTGPVGIAVMTGRVARLGFVYVLQFAAILSINLGIINFIPFPALDGGRIIFLAIEKIRRKPVDEKIEAMIHNIGFILLMILIVAVTFQDIGQFGGKIWESLRGAFR